jgi:hypothetical protein
MWHETLPFEDGERLVIAFDVMKPKLPPPSECTTPPITA